MSEDVMHRVYFSGGPNDGERIPFREDYLSRIRYLEVPGPGTTLDQDSAGTPYHRRQLGRYAYLPWDLALWEGWEDENGLLPCDRE